MNKEQTDSVSAIKKEAREIQKRLRDIRIEERKLRRRLYKIREICPHDEGYDFPTENSMMVISNNRNVCCKICGAAVGKYCKVAKDHICKYPVSFEDADYHEKCTECGKLLEDP